MLVRIERVGSRNSVLGVNRRMNARRAGIGIVRTSGPTTKPMKRSMPVQSTPDITCTKFSSQTLSIAMMMASAANAAAIQKKLRKSIGGASSGAMAMVVWVIEAPKTGALHVDRARALRGACRRGMSARRSGADHLGGLGMAA